MVLQHGESTGKALGLVEAASILPPEKKPSILVKRILLKQHGVLWYSDSVFDSLAGKACIPWSKCGPYTDFKDKRQFFFLTPPAISFSQCVLRPIP